MFCEGTNKHVFVIQHESGVVGHRAVTHAKKRDFVADAITTRTTFYNCMTMFLFDAAQQNKDKNNLVNKRKTCKKQFRCHYKIQNLFSASMDFVAPELFDSTGNSERVKQRQPTSENLCQFERSEGVGGWVGTRR